MSREDIEKLSCLRSFDPIQKKIVLKYRNIKKINHHLELIKNIGYKKWLSISNPYYLNKIIVDEINSN